jgi:hypothetical protein
MAWRLTEYFKAGELDNTVPGKVTGWLEFAGLNERVLIDLVGDFHRDIRGTKVILRGTGEQLNGTEDARRYMEGFSTKQTGTAGDMTAGKEPVDYVPYPYFELYSNEDGRVVIELEPDQVEIVGTPIPAMESFPISRQKQNENMAKFLAGMSQELNIPAANCICVGMSSSDAHNLVPDELRKQLPPLYSQDGKGGKAVAYVKFFLGSWTWFATYAELNISCLMWSSGLCRVV